MQTKKKTKRFDEMRIFSVIWFGQLVSTLGSGLTGFAVGVWIYQKTGSVTDFAINLLAYTLPNLLVSPFAGALADRWDRRVVMILSDTGAGLSTVAVAALFLTGRLEIWHVYVATVFNSAFGAFQWPAYSAATTLLVPKKQLGRAGGMVQIGEALSSLFAPAIAGALLVAAGLQAVLLIDFATYLFALGTLVAVRFPKPPETAAGKAGRGSIWSEAAYGWKYITARSGLFGLLMVFALTNFLNSLTSPLITPLFLNTTTVQVLGYIASFAGGGALLGTIVMSAWGGPKKRIHGVLGFMLVEGLMLVLVGLRPSIPLMATAFFVLMFLNPIVNGSSQALWQSKVAPDVQGRVFAVRRMIAWSIMPLAYLVSGPLADRVFEPLLLPGGLLVDSVGRLIGVGAGRGTALIFTATGALIFFSVLVLGYLNPRVRRVEEELPDAIVEDTVPLEVPEAQPGYT